MKIKFVCIGVAMGDKVHDVNSYNYQRIISEI